MRRWRRRRSRTGEPPERVASPPEVGAPERGTKVYLESRDDEAEAAKILIALGELYEVAGLGETSTCEVTVDDALFADEAVVKVATALDAINRDWEEHLSWPKAHP